MLGPITIFPSSQKFAACTRQKCWEKIQKCKISTPQMAKKKQTILMGSHSWSSLKMPRIFTQLNKNLTKAQEFPEPLEQ